MKKLCIGLGIRPYDVENYNTGYEINREIDRYHIDDVIRTMREIKINYTIYRVCKENKNFVIDKQFFDFESLIKYIASNEPNNDDIYVSISRTNDIRSSDYIACIISAEELYEEFNKKRSFTIKFMDLEKTFEFSFKEMPNNPQWYNPVIKIDDDIHNIWIFSYVYVYETIFGIH